MKASIRYRISNVPHPWDVKRRQAGELAWCLVKVTQPEYGDVDIEYVAIFNLDSEAEQFQAEVIIAGLSGLIDVDPTLKELVDRRLASQRTAQSFLSGQ